MDFEWISENKFFKKIFLFLAVLSAVLGFLIFHSNKSDDLNLYFLDVGQGDSSLALLPGGVKVLVDGGPINGMLERNLEKILAVNDKYIDLVIISHAQQDHFGGLIEFFKNYKIGAVIYSGIGGNSVAWKELGKVVAENKIKVISLIAGDKIEYNNSVFDILSPKKGEREKDANNSALVLSFKSSGIKTLFLSDISIKKEEALAQKFDLNSDILKVGHHGSKFSSGTEFLKEVSPAVSIIEVGKNSYGHPTPQVLARLAAVDSQIYRTDLDGAVKIKVNAGKIEILKSN